MFSILTSGYKGYNKSHYKYISSIICLKSIEYAGFTLLELIISITLLSFVVLIISAVMRSGLRAYERAKDINNEYVLKSSIINLIDKELAAIISKNNPMTKRLSFFEGREDILSFTTASAPVGARGGIFKVSYKFYPEENLLLYCQKIITLPSDIKERPDDITEWNREERKRLIEAGWDCEGVTDIKEFQLRYASKYTDASPEFWEANWKTNGLPRVIALRTWDKWALFFITPIN